MRTSRPPARAERRAGALRLNCTVRDEPPCAGRLAWRMICKAVADLMSTARKLSEPTPKAPGACLCVARRQAGSGATRGA